MQEKVHSYFSEPQRYLKEGYNLRIRKECVHDFTRGEQYENIIDAPCGDASISLPLLPKCSHLTLVDFSHQMLNIALKNIPLSEKEKTEFICSDIRNLNLPYNHYDLIICLGLLSHLKDPISALDALMPLLKSGGKLILQNTDSGHWYFRLIKIYETIKTIFNPHHYHLYPVSEKLICSILQNHGFTLQNQFRYNQSFLGLGRMISSVKKYNLTRKFFGDIKHPKHQNWGSDHIYLFKKL